MADRPISFYPDPAALDDNNAHFIQHESDSLVDPPVAPYMMSNSSRLSPRSSFTPTNSTQLLHDAPKHEHSDYTSYPTDQAGSAPKSRKRPMILLALALLIIAIIVLAVILPVYFTVIKPKQGQRDTATAPAAATTSSAGQPNDNGNPTKNDPTPPKNSITITGGDGSTVTAEDGGQFTYTNKFGGFWWSDPDDPYNNNAQPNSWTPPLNQSWNWNENRVNGVNLGGLFVLEPFISPALFQKYPEAIDEWSLSELMAADTANGGLNQLEEHYQTFITEEDIAEIAGAGLNWIRLPIPFWAIETWPGEPFLAKTSWKYILRVFEWCRKYGLRVNLDLHTIPGSQNGYNHSGKFGKVNFLNGVMGYANAQRAFNYIRIITEFISQPQYKDLVPLFSVMNEPLQSVIGMQNMRSFYLEMYTMLRDITGIGEGKGPFIVIHDSFRGVSSWSDFLPNSDRIVLDTHPYFAFGGGPALDPLATGTGLAAGGVWPAMACNRWGPGMNTSRSTFGITVAGEFSNGINDCALFLNGVGGSASYGGDCGFWQDSSQWNDTIKAGLELFTLASMDTFQDYFFWTWKIGDSNAGHPEAPLWSYQLGLRNGWMPKDPRASVGTCAALGVIGPAFDTFQPWQTGGAGAGALSPTETVQYPWPPAQMSGAAGPVTLLPSYTPTGSIVTLPPPTFTSSDGKNIDSGNGWFDSSDTAPAPTEISGCTYPDRYDAIDSAVPPPCGGAAAAATPPPVVPTDPTVITPVRR